MRCAPRAIEPRHAVSSKAIDARATLTQYSTQYHSGAQGSIPGRSPYASLKHQHRMNKQMNILLCIILCKPVGSFSSL